MASNETAPIDPKEFRSVLGQYPTGVTVVTAIDDDEPVAMVIGSFGSVSLDPPLVMFMPTADSSSWQRIQKAGTFCVNVLAADQLDLCNIFFKKETDPWEACSWSGRVTGAPAIDGCLAWIDCTIDQVVEAGDHLIVLGAVEALGAAETDHDPLLFFKGGYGTFAG